MAGQDLTTLEAVKAYLQIEPSDESSDEMLASLIVDASLEVRTFTRRAFTIDPDGPVREVRILPATGSRRLYLDEVFSADAIYSIKDELDFDLIGWTFKPDSYPRAGGTVLLRDQGFFEGLPKDHLDWFVRNLDSPPGVPDLYVTVDAEFGYDVVPPEIEYQTRRTVAVWNAQTEGGIGEFGGGAADASTESDLPPQVVTSLNLWKIRQPVFT